MEEQSSRELFKIISNKLDHYIEISQDRLERKVDTATFWKVVGIIVTVIVISGAMSTSNKTCITENKVNIEHLQNQTLTGDR